MYQALYRKYRPKTFDDVVGQDVVIQTLKNSIINNKINHAYLLAGPRGCGKTTIAKIFAQLVNCKNTNGINPCGECVFCTQNKDQAMDIIEMDAASNNGVDEIREINNKVNLVPSIGKYKIYIIDEVHMLTIGAFNALLKTLEEPPSHVIFILATTDPQKVPITILSRCQRFDLKKISSQKITERLKYICDKESLEYEEEALLEISKLGDGCLRDSISILDQVISYTDKKITIDDVHTVNGTLSTIEISNLINNIISNDLTNIINLISTYSNSGKSIIKITEDIINYLKSCILMKNNIETENLEIYNQISSNYTTEQLINYIQIMNQTLFDMKKFSDPKLLLELSFIKIISSNKSGNKINVNDIHNNSISTEKQETEKIIKSVKINQEEKIESVKTNQEEVKEESIKQETEMLEKLEPKVTKNISWEIEKKLQEFIELRINNTLAEFSKKLTIELKNNMSNLMDYILDEELGKYVTMVMDATLKAASEKYIIFTHKTEHLSNLFNRNIEQIEILINKQLNKNYKVISVSDDKWDVIKQQFNNKEKEYKYQEENIDIKEILSKLENDSDDDMKSIFGELVEYK